jgi:hypothetical protein
MPYTSVDDLPQPVRVHLPLHAQEIYLAAFNNAWSTNTPSRFSRSRRACLGGYGSGPQSGRALVESAWRGSTSMC